MNFTADHWTEWLLAAADSLTDGLLRVLLLVGLLFATAHLITMLVTRWGDHNATTKSLIFSVLLHLSCVLGLIAFQPTWFEPTVEAESKAEPVEIRRLVVEGEETIELEEKGNTPVWDRIAPSDNVQLSRLDRLPSELKPLESPQRRPEPETVPESHIPDLPSLPEMPVVTPQPETRGEEGRLTEAAVPHKIDDPTAEARPEVNVSTSSRLRQSVIREGQMETEVRRDPLRGAVDRVEAGFEPSRELASIDAFSDPSAFLKRDLQEGETIQRRTGPTPSALPIEEAGVTSTEESQDDSAGGAPTPSRFARRNTRTPQSRAEGGIERFRSERTPRTPAPSLDDAIAVRESVPIDVPRGGPNPNVIRPNFDAVQSRNTGSVPATYRLRNLARRDEIAQKFGGTDESERAVELSLRWLSLHQNVEGFWDADGFHENCPEGDRCVGRAGLVKTDENGVDRQNAGIHADAGLTGLAILAFLGAGYTHEEGQYADNVDRALRWLIRQQREDGYLGGEATHYAQMYCHAMATYALAEAYGMQSDPSTDSRLHEALARAIAYILDNQNTTDGGWRYLKGQKSDMSMFGWQLMALKSAEIAGIEIPTEARDLMIQFLKDRSLGEQSGLAGYREGMPATPSMTAEALFCKQMLGIRRTNPASEEAVEYLLRNLPRRSDLNLYYWYYGTLAMYQYGGEPWRQWNEALRDQLVAEQSKTGHAAGSWNPRGPWGPYGGRIYSTVLSTLCLEVYYRFLPLYQMGGRYDER